MFSKPERPVDWSGEQRVVCCASWYQSLTSGAGGRCIYFPVSFYKAASFVFVSSPYFPTSGCEKVGDFRGYQQMASLQYPDITLLQRLKEKKRQNRPPPPKPYPDFNCQIHDNHVLGDDSQEQDAPQHLAKVSLPVWELSWILYIFLPSFPLHHGCDFRHVLSLKLLLSLLSPLS